MSKYDDFKNADFRLAGDAVFRIHCWNDGYDELGEIREVAFERPEYDPNSNTSDTELRIWIENASFVIDAANSYFDLLKACKEMLEWIIANTRPMAPDGIDIAFVMDNNELTLNPEEVDIFRKMEAAIAKAEGE